MGSSLRTQTDGPPDLPTENTLLAAGAESTAPSKQPNQPGQPTQTPSISPQHLQPHLQSSPAVRILSDCRVSAPSLPNPGLLGAAPSPVQGKKMKTPLNSIWRLPGILPPQGKGNGTKIFVQFFQSKIKPNHCSSETAVTGVQIFKALK